MNYGNKAKKETQREWEEEYQSSKNSKRMSLSDKEIKNIDEIITDDEILGAINHLKEKGVAWDYMSHWVPKLLIRFAPVEIVEIYRKAKILNGNYSEDCVDVEKIFA